MNLKKIRAISKLISFMYTSNNPEATDGTLEISKNSVELHTNGGFRRLSILFNGAIYIYNNLPDGYGIKMNDSSIIITNFLLKNLKNNKILFDYDGNLEITRADITTINGKRINLKLNNTILTETIDNNRTNFEDNSLLFIEKIDESYSDFMPIKKGIDDDSIKGLFAHKPLPDGYTGDYNYHPKENIYMSGKYLTNKSQPVGKTASSFKLTKNKVNLENVIRTKLKVTGQIEKPIRQKQIEVKPKTIQEKTRQEKTTTKEPRRTTKGTGGSY